MPKNLTKCIKCHRYIELVGRSSIAVLYKKCCDEWHTFFHENYERLEQKFPHDKFTNPTWYVYIGKLKDKETFIFR